MDIVWTLVERDGEESRIVVDDLGADRHVEHAAPYGHGGKPPTGTSLMVIRRADGGVAIATPVPNPPAGMAAETGTTWMTDSNGNGVFVNGTCVTLVRAGYTTPPQRLVRDGDTVKPTAAMSAWITLVSRALGIAEPATFGVAVGSSSHTATD